MSLALEQKPQKDVHGLTHRALVGLFWMFSATGGKGVLRLAVLIVLARLITPENFGLVAAALVVVGICQIFSEFGVGPAIVQRPNLTAEHICCGFTICLILGLVFAGVIA